VEAPQHPRHNETVSPSASRTALNRVLVLSASAGAGHARAGQALERALAATGRVREVRHIDVLQYTTKLFRRVYAEAYLDLVNRAPEVFGWVYDYFDEPGKHARLRLALDKLNTTRFVRLLEREQPDWAVSTHFLPAEIIAWLRSKGRLATRQAIVVTDFDVQGMWLTHHVDRYFVALDETRAHLERLGVPSDTITVSGIPIDPIFSTPKDTGAMRAKHGLAPDRTTILVSAGGFGVGPATMARILVTSSLRSAPLNPLSADSNQSSRRSRSGIFSTTSIIVRASSALAASGMYPKVRYVLTRDTRVFERADRGQSCVEVLALLGAHRQQEKSRPL
jgi:hypothetical protein